MVSVVVAAEVAASTAIELDELLLTWPDAENELRGDDALKDVRGDVVNEVRGDVVNDERGDEIGDCVLSAMPGPSGDMLSTFVGGDVPMPMPGSPL